MRAFCASLKEAEAATSKIGLHARLGHVGVLAARDPTSGWCAARLRAAAPLRHERSTSGHPRALPCLLANLRLRRSLRMPKSTTMDLRCVLALVAALAVAAMCCSSAGAIVGGETVSGPSSIPPTVRSTTRSRRSATTVRRPRPGNSAEARSATSVARTSSPRRTACSTTPRRPRGSRSLPRISTSSPARRCSPTSAHHRLHVAAISIDPRYDPAHRSRTTRPSDARGHRPARRDECPADRLRRRSASGSRPPTTIERRGQRLGPNRQRHRTRTICAGRRCRWRPMPRARRVGRRQGADTSIMVVRAASPARTPASGTAAGRSSSRSTKAPGPPTRRARRDRELRRPRVRRLVPRASTRAWRRARSRATSRRRTRPARRRNTSAPIVAGARAVGQTITCAPGSWDGAPASRLPVRARPRRPRDLRI